jgi:hypothetical protein
VRSCLRCVVCAVLLSACAGDAREQSNLEIVESAAPLWTEETRWRIAEQPSAVIGANITGDSTREFGYIAGLYRLPGGAIAVVDAWAPAVMFFDTTGVLLGRIGKRGSGPGEFPSGEGGSVGGTFTCGADTVFVRVAQRNAAYAPPDRYVRTITTDSITRVHACAGNRLIGGLGYAPWRTSPGRATDSIRFAWFDRNGAMQSVIDTLPLEERDWVKAGEGVGYSTAPFSNLLAFAVNDDFFATSYGPGYEIEVRRIADMTSRIFRITGRERTIDDADVGKYREFALQRLRNEDERRRRETSLREADGKPMPAFGEMRYDRAGNLWAREYDHLDAVASHDFSRYLPKAKPPVLETSRRWLVFGPDGRYLGDLSLPPNFTVHEIGHDWILGVWRDELDVQSVRLYPLIKPAA